MTQAKRHFIWGFVLAATLGCGQGPLGDKPGDGVGPGSAGLRGRVLEAISSDVIPGVQVGVGNDELGWTVAETDAQGWFEILNFNMSSTLMRLDGSAASVLGKDYPVVTVQLHGDWVQPGEVTLIPENKYLPNIAESPSVDFSTRMVASSDPAHPAEEGWMEVTEDVEVRGEELLVPGAVDVAGDPIRTTVYATIAKGTYIKFPKDVEPVVSVTQIPVDQLPHRLPSYVAPQMMVTFQPGGTLLDPPAPLHFGDIRNFADQAPEMDFNVWSLSHSKALFLELGDASLTEGSSGSEIVTAQDVGLKELGWHGPVCTTVNFEADVSWFFDDESLVPPDGTVSLKILGGGVTGTVIRTVTNRGGKIQTGNIATCGGYFNLEFDSGLEGHTKILHSVPGWRCAARAGTNKLGQFLFRPINGSTQASVNLSGC